MWMRMRSEGGCLPFFAIFSGKRMLEKSGWRLDLRDVGNGKGKGKVWERIGR